MKARKSRREELRHLADKLVGAGLKAGADEIEVTIYDGHQFEVQVRQQQIEHLVEADPRYCSVRIFKDKRKATFSTSDLRKRLSEPTGLNPMNWPGCHLLPGTKLTSCL